MRMIAVFPDSSWVEVDRNRKTTGWLFNHETKGTHHFIVVGWCDQFTGMVGQEIAIPISSVKFFVIKGK